MSMKETWYKKAGNEDGIEKDVTWDLQDFVEATDPKLWLEKAKLIYGDTDETSEEMFQFMFDFTQFYTNVNIREDEECQEYVKKHVINYVLNMEPQWKIAESTRRNRKILKIMREFSDDFMIGYILDELWPQWQEEYIEVLKGIIKPGDKVIINNDQFHNILGKVMFYSESPDDKYAIININKDHPNENILKTDIKRT